MKDFICLTLTHQIGPLDTSPTSNPVQQTTRVDLRAERNLSKEILA